MAQQIVNNNESGLNCRNAINSNFSELYSAIVQPLKQIGITGNTQQIVPANTYLQSVFISLVSGTPTIRIGTTPNGQEICPDVQPNTLQITAVDQYFANQTTLYVTLSGGEVNIRYDAIQSFF